jgi:PIN domain
VLKSARPAAAWSRIQEVIRDRQMFQLSTFTPAIYAKIYFDLERSGTMIPINDIWIAAIALEAKLPLIARDKHFARVAGLQTINCQTTDVSRSQRHVNEDGPMVEAPSAVLEAAPGTCCCGEAHPGS